LAAVRLQRLQQQQQQQQQQQPLSSLDNRDSLSATNPPPSQQQQQQQQQQPLSSLDNRENLSATKPSPLPSPHESSLAASTDENEASGDESEDASFAASANENDASGDESKDASFAASANENDASGDESEDASTTSAATVHPRGRLRTRRQTCINGVYPTSPAAASEQRVSLPLDGSNPAAQRTTVYPPKQPPLQATDSVAARTSRSTARLMRERIAASAYYRSEEFSYVARAIIDVIDSGKIEMRPDVEFNDASNQERLVSLLSAYSTRWLRHGLEVIFETVIELKPRNPKLQLNEAIARCFISDEWLQTSCHAELRAVMLKRVLILVVFLDHAKVDNVLNEDGDPNLFDDSSSFKSTKDVLVSICHDFMQMKRRFVGYLSRLGISVSYHQGAVDEVVDEPAPLPTAASVPYNVSDLRLEHIKARGRLGLARVRAASLCQSAAFFKVAKRIADAIDAGKIKMRPNINFNDVAKQERLWSFFLWCMDLPGYVLDSKAFSA
jgi:hypothetical protein